MAACTPQDIASLLNCLTQLASRQSTGAWAYFVCNSGPVPPTDNNRAIEDGAARITEDGTTRIIE